MIFLRLTKFGFCGKGKLFPHVELQRNWLWRVGTLPSRLRDGSTEDRNDRNEGPPNSRGILTNMTEWDPAPIGAGGGVTTKLVGLKGVSSGDAVSVGLTSVNAIKYTVQLTATAAEDFVKVVMQNLANEGVDIGSGVLRVVVTKM